MCTHVGACRYAVAIWACCPAAIGVALAAVEGPSVLVRYLFLAGVGLTGATLAAIYPFNFYIQGTFNMRYNDNCAVLLVGCCIPPQHLLLRAV